MKSLVLKVVLIFAGITAIVVLIAAGAAYYNNPPVPRQAAAPNQQSMVVPPPAAQPETTQQKLAKKCPGLKVPHKFTSVPFEVDGLNCKVLPYFSAGNCLGYKQSDGRVGKFCVTAGQENANVAGPSNILYVWAEGPDFGGALKLCPLEDKTCTTN